MKQIALYFLSVVIAAMVLFVYQLFWVVDTLHYCHQQKTNSSSMEVMLLSKSDLLNDKSVLPFHTAELSLNNCLYDIAKMTDAGDHVICVLHRDKEEQNWLSWFSDFSRNQQDNHSSKNLVFKFDFNLTVPEKHFYSFLISPSSTFSSVQTELFYLSVSSEIISPPPDC